MFPKYQKILANCLKIRSKMVPNVWRITWILFLEVMPKENVDKSVWEEIFAQRLARKPKNFSGKFGKIWAKIFRNPKKLPAPRPMCGRIATDSLMLFFTQYKTAWLIPMSSHCLAALPAKMSAFNTHMRPGTPESGRMTPLPFHKRETGRRCLFIKVPQVISWLIKIILKQIYCSYSWTQKLQKGFL